MYLKDGVSNKFHVWAFLGGGKICPSGPNTGLKRAGLNRIQVRINFGRTRFGANRVLTVDCNFKDFPAGGVRQSQSSPSCAAGYHQ